MEEEKKDASTTSHSLHKLLDKFIEVNKKNNQQRMFFEFEEGDFDEGDYEEEMGEHMDKTASTMQTNPGNKGADAPARTKMSNLSSLG